MSVLASADVEELSAAGLISPPSSNGTRRVHKRRLDRLSDEENSHLPLTPILSTSSSSVDVTEMYATIPELLFSLATLKYLGYTDTAAHQIWDRWSNWPSTAPGRYEVDSDGEILFIEVAVSHVRRFRDQDTWDENDGSWFDFMDHCGINLETQNDIMDPIFKRMRLMGSCYFWVKHTIESRYRGLKAIQKASRERTKAGTKRMPAPGISPDSAFSSACTSAPQNNPDSIILYKGIDQARLDRFFDDSGAIVGWVNMLSRSPTDFLAKQAGFCFTVHRDIAEYYACYAKRRDNSQSVAIMQITVPNHKIESLSSTQHTGRARTGRI